MRFNYLSDAPPDIVERLRGVRMSRELRTPLAALLTACIVVLSWSFLERYWLHVALREQAVAKARLDESRRAFAATKLIRANVQTLLALDARLRTIRLSGAELSSRLVDLGNRIPSRSWLTAVGRDGDAFELEGKAEGLNVLSETVAALMSAKGVSSLNLTRAVKEDRSKPALISFAVRLGAPVR